MRRYVATDLADRLPQLRQTILQHGVGQRVTATECLWGGAQAVPTDEAGAWDVVLLCDLLYWQVSLVRLKVMGRGRGRGRVSGMRCCCATCCTGR